MLFSWGLGGGWDLSPLPSLNATSVIIHAQSLLLLQIQSLKFEQVKLGPNDLLPKYLIERSNR